MRALEPFCASQDSTARGMDVRSYGKEGHENKEESLQLTYSSVKLLPVGKKRLGAILTLREC